MDMVLFLVVFTAILICAYYTKNYGQLTAQKYVSPKKETRHPVGQKKPNWVAKRVIYLKAMCPNFGCRKIAALFNNSYGRYYGITVSKSYVAYTLRNHAYELLIERSKRWRHQPHLYAVHALWSLDFCVVTLANGEQRKVLGIIDAGSRKLLMFRVLRVANATSVIRSLFGLFVLVKAPKALRTDNDGVFRSKRFQKFVALFSKHQRIIPFHPWQNGRIERLMGTFRAYLGDYVPRDETKLRMIVIDFYHWYNGYRPHQALGGRPPNG